MVYVSEIQARCREDESIYLVTVPPGEVLGADVLVGVLDALLKGRHVRPMLPMLVPQDVGVYGRADEEDGKAARRRVC